MPVKKEETISAFERRRLENIAANNAILRDISTTAAKVIPLPKPEPAKKRTAAPRVKREPVKRSPSDLHARAAVWLVSMPMPRH